MNIKSLLLGSAAVMVAVTGAQAADAVVIEPEPVDYVRVCDAYGAGFFYIPGTETCLKFSGYVRVTYQSRHYHQETPPTTHNHRVRYRGRLNVDARNETEWGTLRSQLRFQGGDSGAAYSAEDVFSDGNAAFHGSGDANVGIDRALISLGGFRLGYSDDYWTTVGGYGFYKAINDGHYSYGQATFLDYTYAADGFTATIGTQVSASNGTTTTSVADLTSGAVTSTSSAGAVSGSGLAGQPDIYAGATYSGSWGGIFGTYYHDSSESAGAYKVGASLSLGDYIPGGAVKGWYMADDGDTDYVHGHAWGASMQANLGDSLVAYVGYSDWERTDGNTAGNDQSQWSTGVRWNMATGLSSQFEYTKVQTEGAASVGTFSLRVVRSF